jgi:protein-S-isoprenylcysteine O-methyltransferase Ste14
MTNDRMNQEKNARASDASSNVPWPPIIFGLALTLAFVASSQYSAHIVTETSHGPFRWAGIAIILIGSGIAVAAEISFLKAGTATRPTRPTRIIVPNGIYRFTRNPMYLGMSILLAGIGLFANSWWFLLVLPFAIIAVTKLAIEREEAYLERTFGSAYLDYKARTRRWL